MKPTPEPHKKKPSGGRPPNRRLISSDFQQGINSGSSDVSIAEGDIEPRKHIRGPSKVSTLKLLEQVSGEGDPFSDSPGVGAWTAKPIVHTPEAEQDGFSYRSDGRIHAQERTNSSPRPRPYRPLPPTSQPRSQSSEKSVGRHAELEKNSTSREIGAVPEKSHTPLSPTPRRPIASRAWTDSETATLPKTDSDSASYGSGVMSIVSEKLESLQKQRSDKSLSIDSQSRPARSQAAVPPSPSKARWDNLRQHVLPSSSSPHSLTFSATSTTPLTRPSTPQQTGGPSRSQTPKPSRFARLGFRQVVEQVRDIAAVDDTHKFADEILKVCWQSRFLEPTKGSKSDRDPTLTSGAYMPFMSNSSLGNTNTSTTTLNRVTQKKPDLRRPQSVQSLALTNRPVPTVRYIHAMLLHYATPSAEQPRLISFLPHEPQLLSALLAPFTTRTAGKRVDEERWFSIESFEIAVKTWKPSTNQLGVERCLWCCKAASMAPQQLRMRIIATLSSLLLSHDKSIRVNTPVIFITLVQGLFSLLSSFAFLSANSSETDLVKELISRIQSGACGTMIPEALEKEYGVASSSDADEQPVRDGLVVAALGKFLEHGSESSRRWALRYLSEEYWPQPSVSFTPLLKVIHIRKLGMFSRGVLSLLSKTRGGNTGRLDAAVVFRILSTRMVPELEAISNSDAAETRGFLFRIVLELICTYDAQEMSAWVATTIFRWYSERPDWKSTLEKSIQQMIAESDWPATLRTLAALMKTVSDEVRKPLVASFMPSLNDQLIIEPPAHPCLPLTGFLDTVSQLYPQIFYKPLFACAASSKELAIQNHLSILTVISRFLPDFWTRDAEMVSVALMSEGGSKPSGSKPVWGKSRLGQSALLVELIGHVQGVRQAQTLSSHPSQSHVAAAKFFAMLEARIEIFLEAKEKTTLVPLSQRTLFCALFLEIRLLTGSFKSASWLPRIILWLLQFGKRPEYDSNVQIDECVQEELSSSVNKLETLYVAVQNSFRESHKRRSTMPLSPSSDANFFPGTERNGDIIKSFIHKAEFLLSLRDGLLPKVLRLLVTMSGMISQDNYRRIGSLLWCQCLEGNNPHITASACFLTMQCAEKTPSNFLKIVEEDVRSSDSDVRLQAVQKISTLFNWRFQLLSQHVVMDKSHRRLFQLARDPLPFLATDIGSSIWVLEESASQSKDSLPLELRKRLSEIGWAQDDEVVDQKLAWVRTPISLLPSHELDLLDDGFEMPLSPVSPLASPTGSPMKTPSSPSGNDTELLRRKSSSGKHSYAVKRRAVFVPSLSAIFPQLASLVHDSNFSVASSARDTILDLMRNDPALLSRPVFDVLTAEQQDFSIAISTLRAFDHVRRFLPPAMAYHVFNHLAGFLKFAARQIESMEALRTFANSAPTLAKLVTQVSDMSIREIRRAKVEVFLIPSGSLWFPPSAPSGPMFPRMLSTYDDLSETMPSHLVYITMIRLSQNMLFLSMLKRNPQDVQLIRKNMSRLVLPSRENEVDAKPLRLADFVPHKLKSKLGNPSTLDPGVRGISLMLSRSILLLIAQIFRSMSRHLNDRNELAVLIDGLNRILLIHGDDIGIVSQAMIALMAASTRFRRLFTSGGGYTLFMPVLIKVYAESEAHAGIRLAIEYAVDRFYALHQEAFIFQSLDIIAHVVMVPDIEGDWLAKCIFSLFSTLRMGISRTAPDAAGIHDSNKTQEREALIVRTAEDKPQTFLASLRRGGGQGKNTVLIDLPEEYETKRLALDNFVRLFLTVIAHDPTILRAEHFMHFLRLLTPYLYHASSSARSILRDGIDALGVVLAKAVVKAKGTETFSLNPTDDFNFEIYSQQAVLENQLLGTSKMPSNIAAMRLDYLSMIVTFARAGGHLGAPAIQRTMDLVKLMLRDSVQDNRSRISLFLSEYTSTSLIREPSPSLKEVVAFLGQLFPIISTYATTADFSGVFEAISSLTLNPMYANESSFSRVIMQFCSIGLDACDLAASQKIHLSFASRPSIARLVSGAIFLRDADVIAEVEKHIPTYEFLIGTILPLVMTLKTTADVVSDGHWADSWRRDVHARTWTRILTYVMSACQMKEGPRDTHQGPERTKSQIQDKRRSTPSSKAQMMTLVAAIQIIKAIVIRAEDDLSACLPGIWSRIASFLKSLLADGDANFALTAQDRSVPPSPVQSPRASALSFNSHISYDQTMSASVSADLQQTSNVNPRVVDYSLWSLLELLCLSRSPLVIQMRLFLQEKVVILGQELRYYQDPTRSRSKRLSSTIFSKPRRRTSTYLSGVISPENSPTLSISPSFPSDPSLFHLDPTRQPGYQRFPSSPEGMKESTSGPRIVHLGPVNTSSASGFRESLSPNDAGVHLLNKSAIIKSRPLVWATYRRIRLVQTCMGYDNLLPLPNMHGIIDIDDDLGNVKAWTKKQAMEAVVKETRELMVEFEEPWREVEDDVVLIDADQSVTF